MSYSSTDNNTTGQKTMNSFVGGSHTKDFDSAYIDRQKNVLTQQKQEQLGKIPHGIKRTSHSDPIQSTLYGFNNQEVDLGVNDTSIDKYHQYNPNYDYLNKNGLLRENFKYQLNTTQINIDSSSRNINPLVSYDVEINLPTDPLSFGSLTTQVGISSSKSNLLVIKCPNHNFVKSDRFSMGGINNDPISINTMYKDINDDTTYAVTFTPNSFAVSFSCIYRIETTDNSNIVIFDSHFKVGPGINYSTLKAYDTSNLKVKISGFTQPLGVPSVGNIPINFLNGTHQVYFINPDPNNLATNPVNVPYSTPDGQKVKITGFYILLDKAYHGAPPMTNYVLTLQFNHYGGTPLNQLNAEFPIDANHTFGYHEVFYVTDDTIVTKINNVAYYNNEDGTSASFGGNSMYISKITNLIYGYSSPNYYVVNLPRSIHNIISVKLISTIFPNTSKIIRDDPNNNNNMLYWQNQDDGNVTYSISLDAGNYTPESLKTAIETKVYSVQRKYITVTSSSSSTNSTNYTNANFMNVSINTDTNAVTFKSYKEALLKNPISQIDPQIQAIGGNPPFTITIRQDSHGLKVGDSVLLSGFITTMGIPDTILNTTQVVTAVPSTGTYQFVLDNFNLYTGTRTDTQGGYAAKAYVPNNFKLLFNSPNTFGTLLGFRNVGDDTSVTKFGTTLSNYDAYDDEVVVSDVNGNLYVYNKSGNTSLLTSNNIKLSGYDYILMSIEELNTTTNLGTSTVPKYFAKINLAGLPGKILYDTFVPTSTMTYDPIAIDKLTIKFYAPDGSLFDFNGVDHSFVLEFMTEDHIILEAGTVSNKTIF